MNSALLVSWDVDFLKTRTLDPPFSLFFFFFFPGGSTFLLPEKVGFLSRYAFASVHAGTHRTSLPVAGN